MFLFESSKEKQIRQNVQKNMESCISNPKKYNEAKQVLIAHLKDSDQKVIEMIVDNIKSTIKNEDFQPVRKYQAILLLKDLMTKHNNALGKYVVKKILKRLTILAQHKSGNRDQREEQRGKDIFGPVKKDQQQYAVKFFNTLLMALEQWGKNWPKNIADGPQKQFSREYKDLLMNGVQFPKQRPKQTSLSVSKTGGRIPREEVRISPQQTSEIKNKSIKQQKPKATSPPPRKGRISQNSNLRAQIDKYYEDTKQPLQLLITLLPQFAAQELPVIRDIIGQIQKTIEGGNQLVISIEGDPNFHNDDLKIKKCFDFITKVQKDLRILSKKPEQLEAFRNKYKKLSSQLLDTLTKNIVSSSVSPISNDQQARSRSISPLPTTQQIVPKSEVKIEEGPKIKNPNRYVSVTGNQVLQKFSKNLDYQSNGGQSVHSDRYGSFGGGATHRASIPTQGSPEIQKIKGKPNSDKKQQAQKSATQQVLPIPEQKTLQLSRPKIFSEKQIQKNPPKQKIESESLFKNFQGQNKKSQKGSVKNVSNFEDNNSFAPHQFQKENPSALSQDFFAKLQQNNNAMSKGINQNPRRKRKQQNQDDVFNNKIASHVKSQLSGFDFSQKFGDGSRVQKINKQTQQRERKSIQRKQKFDDNPFGFETQNQNESKHSIRASNFFDKFDPNKSGSVDFFNKSIASHKSRTQNNQIKVPENPFATGNFGNMAPNSQPNVNPFDAQSVKSRTDKFNNSNDNPFGNSFQATLKKADQLRRSGQHSFNYGSNKDPKQNRNNENPFQSKIYENNQNPFQQKVNTSKHSIVNPFQTSTHKSNKNPFDEVAQFFRPPTKPSIEGMSERNSFKNIENQQSNNKIIGGNNLHFQQPIRDSLVLSARIQKDQSEYGLRFSQFADIGAPKNQQEQTPARTSDPFNNRNQQARQFSGFSLSNFPGIGEPEHEVNPRKTQFNGSATDFFAKFERQSQKSKSKQQIKKQEPLKQTNNFFENFDMKNSSENDSKSQKKKNSNQNRNFIFERQKTQVSQQQKYDFQYLDNVSAIQKKAQEKNEFEVFTQWGKTQQNTKRQMMQIDNQQQKSLSWGDFDRVPNDRVSEKVIDSKSQKQSNNNSNRQLEVQSRIKINATNSERQINPNKESNKVIGTSKQNSIHFEIQDFAPISKKGIEWNPLTKFSNLKPSSAYVYNVDDRKVELKRIQLGEKRKQYNDKLQIFKRVRSKNEQIRKVYLQKMKKVEDINNQKTQYQQILNKIKQTNQFKFNKISQINDKIKKASHIKNQILQKQKKLYEITKNQFNGDFKKGPTQVSMSSKWQMFNKNLENNRNSMYTMPSQYSYGY